MNNESTIIDLLQTLHKRLDGIEKKVDKLVNLNNLEKIISFKREKNDKVYIWYEQINPKARGCAAYIRYEKYKAATTFEEAKKLGSLQIDFGHDRKMGFLKYKYEDVGKYEGVGGNHNDDTGNIISCDVKGIVDFLNTSINDVIEYKEWLKCIKPSQEYLDIVLKHGFADGIFRIFKSLSRKTIPLCCYKQKENTIFINIEGETDVGGVWKEMEHRDFIYLVNSLHKLVTTQFYNNSGDITDIKKMDAYHKNIQKVMGPSDETVREKILSRIKTHIFNYMKLDLKIN